MILVQFGSMLMRHLELKAHQIPTIFYSRVWNCEVELASARCLDMCETTKT